MFDLTFKYSKKRSADGAADLMLALEIRTGYRLVRRPQWRPCGLHLTRVDEGLWRLDSKEPEKEQLYGTLQLVLLDEASGLPTTMSIDATPHLRAAFAKLERPPVGQRRLWAVIIGISDYVQISDLALCDEDANSWYEYLKLQPYLGGVTMLGDHTSKYDMKATLATPENVTTAIRDMIQRAGANDVVAILSSGHGNGDKHGASYLNLIGGKCTDKELGTLAALAAARDVNLFVSLDHCFSGGILEELVAAYKGSQTASAFVCSTCSEDGYGFDFAGGSHGAWTWSFLLKGLMTGGPLMTTDLAATFRQATARYPYRYKNGKRGNLPMALSCRRGAIVELAKDPNHHFSF